MGTDKCPATKAHAARMKALEEGETIQANCKLSIEENIDDESGDASGKASTAFEAADKDCGEVTNEFNQCTIKAYQEFMNAVRAGDDGRPDWFARKSCNYMAAAIEILGLSTSGSITPSRISKSRRQRVDWERLSCFLQR